MLCPPCAELRPQCPRIRPRDAQSGGFDGAKADITLMVQSDERLGAEKKPSRKAWTKLRQMLMDVTGAFFA